MKFVDPSALAWGSGLWHGFAKKSICRIGHSLGEWQWSKQHKGLVDVWSDIGSELRCFLARNIISSYPIIGARYEMAGGLQLRIGMSAPALKSNVLVP